MSSPTVARALLACRRDHSMRSPSCSNGKKDSRCEPSQSASITKPAKRCSSLLHGETMFQFAADFNWCSIAGKGIRVSAASRCAEFLETVEGVDAIARLPVRFQSADFEAVGNVAIEHWLAVMKEGSEQHSQAGLRALEPCSDFFETQCQVGFDAQFTVIEKSSGFPDVPGDVSRIRITLCLKTGVAFPQVVQEREYGRAGARIPRDDPG